MMTNDTMTTEVFWRGQLCYRVAETNSHILFAVTKPQTPGWYVFRVKREIWETGTLTEVEG